MYVAVMHIGTTSPVTSMKLVLLICNNEVLSAIDSTDTVITYQVGTTETINVGTIFTA
jgi:hypothetical protein